MKRKILLSAFLLFAVVCVAVVVRYQLVNEGTPRAPTLNYPPYDGELIYEDRIAGYYGYGDRIRTCVRVTDNIDLQILLTQAQACGYDVTYRPAHGGIIWIAGSPRSSEEYCSVSRSIRDIDIRHNAGENESSFDYAVPTFALVDCDYRTPEDWFESRLHEFFPQLTDKECSDYAERLASDYRGVNISGSPDWESVKSYLGAFSNVNCVPIESIYEYYSRGRIGYELPSVTIKQEIVLEIDKSVVFTVSANSQGFVTINVSSKYLLNKNWIREVFAEMFFDIGLPVNGISKFTITENWIGQLD